jgi:hypothetical protein
MSKRSNARATSTSVFYLMIAESLLRRALSARRHATRVMLHESARNHLAKAFLTGQEHSSHRSNAA